MLDGLDRVWQAAEILAGDDGGLRQRLKQARGHLLPALDRPDQWPADLLSIARSIERIIGERNGADPLDTMRLDLARQAAEDILSLAADVSGAFQTVGRIGAVSPANGNGTADCRCSSPGVAGMANGDSGIGVSLAEAPDS
jgi:hypothetical protein